MTAMTLLWWTLAAGVGLAATGLLVCGLVGAIAASLDRGAAREAKQPHRCPICRDLAADEANGILRTDFELWESEWTP